MDALLTSLADHRGFCVYRLAPVTGKPGKVDKIPFDGLTGYNSNAQNPATWLKPAEALALASEWAPIYKDGTGVGLVIYEGCGLAFIDLDGCLVEGSVQPYALEIIARFPGAVVEISQSKTGLHIFFRHTGVPRPHKTKNKTWHIEAYTKDRFAALTGNYLPGHEAGWIGTDHTQALDAFLAQYFPADGADFEGEWTTEPEPGWKFLTDDAELIRWAETLRDPRAVYGGKASFPALFSADADTLGQFFPSSTGQPYDASSADQALANFFAWATGNHCERVATLMERSALKRDKWQRDDYFRTTIAKACAGPKKWPTLRAAAAAQAAEASRVASVEAQQKQTPVVVPVQAPEPLLALSIPVPPVTVPPVPDAMPAAPDAPERGAVFFTHDQQKHFEGYVYVEDIHRVMDPQGFLLEKKQFDVREPFAGRDFQMTFDGAKPGKSAWDAFTAGLLKFPKVRGQYFEPREAPGAMLLREGALYVNTWQPIAIDATPGDVTWFLDHLRKLLPVANDAHILLQFLKFMVQHKGEKAAWFPFIQGVEGNGKSFINDTMQYCLSERYTHTPRAKELDGRFNSAFYGKLFIRIEDIQLAEARHIWETLKPMVDGKRLEIEYKGVDKVAREVCFNMIATSNHKDGIPVTSNDRRVAPFFCAQQQLTDLVRDGMDAEYFDRLWDTAEKGGWAAVLHYLSTDPIDPVYNPAAHAIRAPATSSTFEAKATALGPVEQEILEAIEVGAEGFRGGWICSAAVDRLLRNSGKDKSMSLNKRRAMLAGLGYIPHPGLADGRVAMPLPDGTKPRLYVKAGHASCDVTDRALVRQLYLNVNGAPGVG